jgi:hypothetical protein
MGSAPRRIDDPVVAARKGVDHKCTAIETVYA